MPDKITLILPLPPSDLSPNVRLHHMQKAKAARQYRQDCSWCGFAEIFAWKMDEDWGSARVRMTETYRIAGRRKRDVRNLFAAFKAGEDGLVDAGILPGDDDSVLEHGSPRIVRVSGKKDEGVLVEIEEIT